MTSLLGTATQITRQYEWEFQGRTWRLTHTFSAEHYLFFQSLPRTTDYTEYGLYVDDPRDDEQLASFVTALEAAGLAADLAIWDRLHLAIAFVQSLHYVREEGEYPRYPLEMLVDGRGDCEDFAILTAAILREMGFGVILLAYREEMHMAAGIRVVPPNSAESKAIAWDGDAYYYLETTSPGWQIGQIPESFTSNPDIIGVASPFP